MSANVKIEIDKKDFQGEGSTVKLKIFRVKAQPLNLNIK